MKKSTSGFTLVELLIVIVVIGILAAIAIVAYNGIQTRAQNTKLVSAFDAYEKALQHYKTLNGSYPAFTAAAGQQYACLGTTYPATATFAKDKCYIENGTDSASVSASVNTNLLTVLSKLPDTASYELHLSDGANTYHLRGIQYYGVPTGNTAILYYYIQGTQKCGRGTDAPLTVGSTAITMCSLALS